MGTSLCLMMCSKESTSLHQELSPHGSLARCVLPHLGFAWGAACTPQHLWDLRTAVCAPWQGTLPGKEGDARLWLRMPRSSVLQQRREAGIAITTATIV